MAAKWLKKLQPGNILAGIVSTFVPGGDAAVSVVKRSIASVKQTIGGAAQQAVQQVAAARAAGTPAVYQTPPAPVIQASAGSPALAGATPWLLAGGAALAFIMIARRR